MQEILYPDTEQYWVAHNADGSVLHVGSIGSDTMLRTGQPVLEHTDDINEHLATLSAWSDQFEPLPSTGAWLEAGDMYRHGDGVLIVRQSHTRTEHEPADVPALFLVAREPGTGIEWIAGEQVAVGTRRTYDGVTYQAVQAHVTEFAPPLVPALWMVVQDEPQPGVWQPGVSYSIGDVVTYGGAAYRCLQPHTSQAGWEPPNVPALWELVE